MEKSAEYNLSLGHMVKGLLSVEFCEFYAINDLEKMIYEFYKNSKIGMNYEKILWILESIIDGSYDIVNGEKSLRECVLAKFM